MHNFLKTFVGRFYSSSFKLEKNSIVFAEKESRILDTLQRFEVRNDLNAVILERNWMNSYHNSDRYDTGDLS